MMLKKTTERTKGPADRNFNSTITTTYRLFGKTIYVRVVDYALVKEFPDNFTG